MHCTIATQSSLKKTETRNLVYQVKICTADYSIKIWLNIPWTENFHSRFLKAAWQLNLRTFLELTEDMQHKISSYPALFAITHQQHVRSVF